MDGSRVELLSGRLRISPAPSGPHQWAMSRLANQLDDALTAAGRSDLYVVPSICVEISRPSRTALIPDIVLLAVEPRGQLFAARDVRLIGEIWAPHDDRSHRAERLAAYAAAGVPHVWTVDQDRLDAPTITAHRLGDHGHQAAQARTAGPATITAAPVPVRVDPSAFAL